MFAQRSLQPRLSPRRYGVVATAVAVIVIVVAVCGVTYLVYIVFIIKRVRDFISLVTGSSLTTQLTTRAIMSTLV